MGQVTTPTNDAPVTYPDRIYNGKDFDTNINREQSSDNLTTVLTDRNEVLGFPDHTSTQEMQAAIEADRNGSISTYKPTFYDKNIRPALENLGMTAFQPPFITDIKPTPERAFATSFARAATADVFKPEFSDQEARANPIPAFAGSLVGSVAAFATGGALLDGFKLSQLTPFAENIIKGGILGGAYRGVSETSNELRDQDHPDLAKIGQGVLHDALWWGGISGLAGAASKPVGVAASAGLGYLMAKSDGADEPSALLNGAVLGGFHLLQTHGDQEDVRQLVTDKIQSNIADYIRAKNPMVHEEVAKQGGREYIANHAEDAIDQANQAIQPEKTENGLPETGIETPQAKEIEQKQQFPRPEKPIEDGYDPKLLDYLSQYIPVDRLVRLSGSERTSLGKAPESDLESYKMQYDAMAQILAGEKSQAESQKLVQPDVDRMINEGGKVNALEEAAKSKTILNQVMKNLTQEITLKEGGEASPQPLPNETLDINQSDKDGGKSIDESGNQNTLQEEKEPIPSKENPSQEDKTKESQQQEVDKQETSLKESVPQNSEEGKVAKAASDINDSLVQNGFEALPDEEKAKYTPIKAKEEMKKVSDLITNDYERAKDMATGRKPVNGVAPQVLFNAVKLKAYADNDIQTQLDLAKSPVASARARAAQELGSSGFNNGDELDTVRAIQEINKSFEKKNTKSDKQELKKAEKTINKNFEKAKKESNWDDFIESIKC